MRLLHVLVLADDCDADPVELAHRLRTVADRVERGAQFGNASHSNTLLAETRVGSFHIAETNKHGECVECAAIHGRTTTT